MHNYHHHQFWFTITINIDKRMETCWSRCSAESQLRMPMQTSESLHAPAFHDNCNWLSARNIRKWQLQQRKPKLRWLVNTEKRIPMHPSQSLHAPAFHNDYQLQQQQKHKKTDPVANLRVSAFQDKCNRKSRKKCQLQQQEETRYKHKKVIGSWCKTSQSLHSKWSS